MRPIHVLSLGGLVALSAGLAFGQSAGPPLLRFSFDDDDGGWVASGTNARASLTQQTSFNGKGCLKFEYDVKPGVHSMLVLSTPDGLPAAGKALRFWVSADEPSSLAVLLQEKDGGRYTAPFFVPKGRWQEVALSVADFVLAEGPGDPKDPDGRLDIDQVAVVAILDVLQAFGAADNPEMAKLIGVRQGARTLRLDDFMVTGETLPGAFTAPGGEVRLDTFARPQVSWVGLGVNDLARIEGATAAERGLQAVYRPAAGRLVALMRMMPRGKLKGVTRLSFRVAASRATNLIVQVEEAGGGKFNMPIQVAEGSATEEQTVKLDELNAADDSRVKDRKVRPELISQVLFLDISGAMGAVFDSDVTLRLLNLRAYSAK